MNGRETIFRRGLKGRGRSGIILIVVLWILVILSFLAVGLGRRTAVDVSLTKFTMQNSRSHYAARGGAVYALDLVRRDTESENGAAVDTLYACGADMTDRLPEEVFANLPVGGDKVTIYHMTESGGVPGVPSEARLGMMDEERKFNLNALTRQNMDILRELILLRGFDEETAGTVAASAVDWIDADGAATNAPFGAEEDHYQGLDKPYHAKNRPFDNVEELRLVRGVSDDVYEAIRPYVTVFPRLATRLRINVNTAESLVIQALGRSVVGPMTNTEPLDADTMTEKVVAYRRGPDGRACTEDDRPVDLNELGLTAKERAVYLSIRRYLTDVSQFIRFLAKGNAERLVEEKALEAVIRRQDLGFVYWQRH